MDDVEIAELMNQTSSRSWSVELWQIVNHTAGDHHDRFTAVVASRNTRRRPSVPGDMPTGLSQQQQWLFIWATTRTAG